MKGVGDTHISLKRLTMGPNSEGKWRSWMRSQTVKGVRAKAFKTTVGKRRTSMSGVFGCRTKSQASYSTRLIPDLPKA